MFGRPGGTCMEITWIATPFRGDKFEAAWAPVAAAVLDYGASGYAFYRSGDDPLKFKQLAFVPDKLTWERYWYSEEVAEVRTEVGGYFHLPLVPAVFRTIGAETRSPESVDAP